MGNSIKVNFEIDVQKFTKALAQEVMAEIKPFLIRGEPEAESLFTVKSLAKYLEVSTQWVYERIQKNEIPFIKVGKFPRFRRQDVESWIDSQRVPVVNPLSRPLKHFPKKNCG